MIICVRFTHSTGNVDFYEEEEPVLNIGYFQKIDLFTKRTNKINLYEVGYPYRIFTLTVRLTMLTGHNASGPLTRLEELYNQVDPYNQAAVMTLYYRYRTETTAEYAKVQMFRSDLKKLFDMGETRRETVDIRFLETLTPPTDVVVQEDIIIPTKFSCNVSDEIVVPIQEV